MKNKILTKFNLGFTLVELLVVISIIGILTVISASTYSSAQIKARDSQRKSDLDQISKALMLYYADNGVFPAEFPFGNSSVGFTGANATVYMRQTPSDPKHDAKYTYVYKISVDFKKFNLFANLENKKDSQCVTPGYNINNENYCYGVSSPNTIVDPNQF